MADPIREWVRDVLEWVRSEAGDVEKAAETLLTNLRGGVKPPPPDQTGTPLGGPPVDG